MILIATDLIFDDKNQLVTCKDYVEKLYSLYKHVSRPRVYYAMGKEHSDGNYMLDYSIETSHCKEIEYEEYSNFILNKKIVPVSIEEIEDSLLKSLCNYIVEKKKQQLID